MTAEPHSGARADIAISHLKDAKWMARRDRFFKTGILLRLGELVPIQWRMSTDSRDAYGSAKDPEAVQPYVVGHTARAKGHESSDEPCSVQLPRYNW